MTNFRTLTRRTALAGLLVSALAAPLAAQDTSIAGNYRVEGRNPDGQFYEGTAVISQTGTAVEITWSVATQSYTGNGTMDGKVVEVSWGEPAPVVYVVMSGGELHGTWANGTGLERLLPQ